MGPDIAFLDEIQYVRTRLHEKSAQSDPFLTLLTPNGVPIGGVYEIGMQQGRNGSTTTLKLRMAMKTVEQHNILAKTHANQPEVAYQCTGYMRDEKLEQFNNATLPQVIISFSEGLQF